MNRQSLKFDPTIAAIAKPSKENWGTALGDGLVKLGAVANQIHDRNRKEQFENSAEARAAEKHSLSMAKGAQGMSLAAQKNTRAAQSHAASMREKGWDVLGSAYGGGGTVGGCSGGSCGSAVSGDSESGVSGGCADGSCGSTVSATVDTASDSADTLPAWGMKWVGKPVTPTKEEKLYMRAKSDPEFDSFLTTLKTKQKPARKTTAQLNYELAKQDPGFAEFLTKTKRSTKTKTYAPSPARKAYDEDLSSLPEDQRDPWKKKHPFIEYRKNYLQTKKMTGGLTAASIISKRMENLAQKLGTEDLSSVNFDKAVSDGKIKPVEVQSLVRKMASSDQAKTLDRVMAQKAGALSEIASMAHRFGRYATSDNVTTNIAKKYLDDAKAYVPGLNYDEAALENEAFRRDFLNVTATMLKLQSGLTVSDKERANFERSLGTLSKNKKANFIGLKQKLLDTANYYEGIRDIDPVFFNFKYGYRLRNLQQSIGVIDKFLHNESPEQNNSAPVKKQSLYQKQAPQRKIVRTGVHNGKKVVQYSDGSIEYVE